MPKLLRFRKRTLPFIVTLDFFVNAVLSLLCVSTIQRSRYTRVQEDVVRVAHGVRATRDRIKRANYNRHDLNRRFIWEIVYLLLSTNKIFLYTSESNQFVFINICIRSSYTYIFFPSSKIFYQSRLLICTILFLALTAIYIYYILKMSRNEFHISW